MLPQITYRFTENFSATVGVNFFWGRCEQRDIADRAARHVGNRRPASDAYQDAVENGLAVVRERDEVFLRLRYTF